MIDFDELNYSYFTVLTKASGEQVLAISGLDFEMSMEITTRFVARGSSYGEQEYAEASVCYKNDDDIYEIARFSRGSKKPLFDYSKEWLESIS